MKYRSEIDGLRAIAVVPVILFHASFELFSGGFVGVDVFFVISGYLITTIIVNEMDEGKFSLLNFYERRARRILPALFFVVLCCIPFAWFLLLSSDMKDFAGSLVAVSTFSSNILFWRESGYFDTAAELKPLLHTWSLAVEEQFYILFPLFLMAAWRFGKRAIVWTLIASFVISLSVAHWGAYNKPAATFFLLPTRAWELLTGSFAAFYLQRDSLRTPLWLNNLLSAAGLLAILYAVFAFDEATPFPSLYALVPTVGTVLVILFALKGTLTHTVLSLRGVVAVGLISYSLYLWHQPVFAFWRHYNVFEPTQTQMLVLSLLCLPLAFFTYRFLETPLRLKAVHYNRKKVFLLSSLLIFVLSTIGIAGHLTVGFQQRLTPTQRAIIAQGEPVSFNCDEGILCQLGRIEGHFSGVAFIGDSHMDRYAYLLNSHYNDTNSTALFLAKGWCAPVLQLSSNIPGRCGGNNRQEYDEALLSIIQNSDVHSVVLAAEWANYTTGYRYLSEPMLMDFAGDGNLNLNIDGNSFEFQSALSETVSILASSKKKVLIIHPVPEYNFRVPQVALVANARGIDTRNWTLKRSAYDLRNEGVFRAFDALEGNVSFVGTWKYLCEENTCLPFDERGFPLYSDGNHLVTEGMRDIVAAIIESLNSE